jgi:drug/metabolite transporter (DMT)-like permease
MKKALILGIIASFFFAFTFILNKQMNISGGSWLWSASLRYIFMLPFLLVVLIINKELFAVIIDIKKNLFRWLLWSTIGFGLFYAPLCFASSYGSSWLVAGTWQITIIAGALMSPLFFSDVVTNEGIVKKRNKVPLKPLMMSVIILIGIFLMQLQEATHASVKEVILGIVPVLIAAFAYPLGNRKMIELCDKKFSTLQRVFGMTLCSMPFWLILSFISINTVGVPSESQLFQSIIVAIFSGIIATILFFKATDLVAGNTHQLAIIESTQAGEVIFALLGGVLLFNDQVPTPISLFGISLVVIGMILNSMAQSHT